MTFAFENPVFTNYRFNILKWIYPNSFLYSDSMACWSQSVPPFPNPPASPTRLQPQASKPRHPNPTTSSPQSSPSILSRALTPQSLLRPPNWQPHIHKMGSSISKAAQKASKLSATNTARKYPTRSPESLAQRGGAQEPARASRTNARPQRDGGSDVGPTAHPVPRVTEFRDEGTSSHPTIPSLHKTRKPTAHITHSNQHQRPRPLPLPTPGSGPPSTPPIPRPRNFNPGPLQPLDVHHAPAPPQPGQPASKNRSIAIIAAGVALESRPESFGILRPERE
jgi:hypothetical protein